MRGLAQEFLDDSVALLDRGRFRSSIDIASYSVHYSAIALLSKLDVRPPRSYKGLVNVLAVK